MKLLEMTAALCCRLLSAVYLRADFVKLRIGLSAEYQMWVKIQFTVRDLQGMPCYVLTATVTQ